MIGERVLGCMVLMLEKGDENGRSRQRTENCPALVTKLVGVHGRADAWMAGIAIADVDHLHLGFRGCGRHGFPCF
jgi:hypothetical protein